MCASTVLVLNNTAQTNIQLYNQLLEQGFPPEELSEIGFAYELGARRFAGLLRPGGKCFLAHTVGVASLVARMDGNADTVSAALLHAWFSHGARVYSALGLTPGVHATPAALNTGVRERIVAFRKLQCDIVTRQDAINAPNELAEVARDALLIYLANELETHVDYGSHYRTDTERADRKLTTLQPVAECLLTKEYADRLWEELRQEPPRALPAELRSDRRGSYTGSRRPGAALKRLIRMR